MSMRLPGDAYVGVKEVGNLGYINKSAFEYESMERNTRHARDVGTS
jgi:hypothetical protein